jgi:cellobiose PTS system EIIA component
MEIERMVMKLIVASGNAKSKAMEAISAAREGDYARARAAHGESVVELQAAHETQTDLIQEESDGKMEAPSMLFIHAQDHLMGAMLVSELALEFIELYERTGKRQ